MTNNTLFRKAFIIVLCTVLAIVFSAAVTGSQVHAKTKYRLPKKIVEYYWVDDGVKWIGNKDTFKYNKKGDPIKIVHRFYEENSVAEKTTYTFKHKYKKSKKVKTTVKRNGKKYGVVTYDKKGRISKVTIASEEWIDKYKYGKKGYLASIKATDYGETRTITFTPTLKKGKLKKMKVYYPPGDGDEAYQYRYYGSTGLLTKVELPLSDIVSIYKYKKKNGLVKKMFIDDGEGSNGWYEYTYSKTKVSKSKYAQVINYDERTLEGIF